MFQKDWFEIVEAAPAQLDLVRGWDLAAIVPEPGRDPDWTAKVKMGRCREGFFWILDVIRNFSLGRRGRENDQEYGQPGRQELPDPHSRKIRARPARPRPSNDPHAGRLFGQSGAAHRQ
jgi:hypothetical protein